MTKVRRPPKTLLEAPATISPYGLGIVPQYEPRADADFEMTPEQSDIYFRTREWRQLALWADPGLGKTRMMLDKTGWLWTNGHIEALTLVVPLKAVGVWPYQMELWWESRIPRNIGHYNGGSMTKKQADSLRKLYTEPVNGSNRNLRVCIFHHESLSTPKGKEAFEAWKKRWGSKSLLVVDESHHYKTYSSVRTKSLIKQGAGFKFRVMMSGTPMNEYIDLFAQYRVLENFPGEYSLARTLTEFKALYCTLRKMDRYDIIVGYRNVKQLIENLKPITITLREQDCAQLPEVRCVDVYSELSPEQKKHYESLRDLYIAEIEDGLVVTEQIAMLRVRRLQEVLSGFLRINEKGDVRELESPRVDLCVQEFTERPVKTIVWAVFQPEVARLQRAFKEAGVHVYSFHGGNLKTRQEELAAFQRTPDPSILLMTAAAGGEALTILEPTQTIWFSNLWSYLKTHQANKRNHRIGQKQSTIRKRIIARGTVDERIIRVQDMRQSMSDLLKKDGGSEMLLSLLAPLNYSV